MHADDFSKDDRLVAEQLVAERRRNARAPALGMLFGAIGTTAAFGTLYAQLAVSKAIPINAVWLASMLASTLLFRRSIERRFGVDAPVIAAIAVMLLAPVCALIASGALGSPIADAHWRCGTGDVGLVMVGPMVSCGVAVIACLFAEPIAKLRRRAQFGRTSLALAIIAICGAAMLLILGTIRSTRFVEPDRWIETRPVVARIEPSAWSNRHERPRVLQTDARVDVDQTLILGRTLERECSSRDSCQLRWATMGDEARGYWSIGQGDTLIVKHDAASGFFLFGRAGDSSWSPSHPTLGARTIYTQTLRGSLGPPRAWLASAAIGILVAIALLSARRSIGRGVELSLAKSARFADGFLHFDDDTRASLPRRIDCAEGAEVTVFLRPPSAIETHRTSPTREVAAVSAGTIDELRDRLDARRAAVTVLAIAAAVGGAAPLIACLRLGLA